MKDGNGCSDTKKNQEQKSCYGYGEEEQRSVDEDGGNDVKKEADIVAACGGKE